MKLPPRTSRRHAHFSLDAKLHRADTTGTDAGPAAFVAALPAERAKRLLAALGTRAGGAKLLGAALAGLGAVAAAGVAARLVAAADVGPAGRAVAAAAAALLLDVLVELDRGRRGGIGRLVVGHDAAAHDAKHVGRADADAHDGVAAAAAVAADHVGAAPLLRLGHAAARLPVAADLADGARRAPHDVAGVAACGVGRGRADQGGRGGEDGCDGEGLHDVACKIGGVGVES